MQRFQFDEETYFSIVWAMSWGRNLGHSAINFFRQSTNWRKGTFSVLHKGKRYWPHEKMRRLVKWTQKGGNGIFPFLCQVCAPRGPFNGCEKHLKYDNILHKWAIRTGNETSRVWTEKDGKSIFPSCSKSPPAHSMAEWKTPKIWHTAERLST